MTRYVNLGQRNPNCTATYHGTRTAYRYGCRCPHAREAERLGRKRSREGRNTSPMVEAIGTRRRLQALAAIGWTFTNLAERLDMWPGNLRDLARDTRTLRHRDTARKVAALYRDLAGVPGPSQVARSRAAAKGWLSPAWWDNIDDPNEQPAVQLVTAGETLDERRARHAARRAEFVKLHAAGQTRRQIRDALRINNIIYNELAASITTDRSGQVAA